MAAIDAPTPHAPSKDEPAPTTTADTSVIDVTTTDVEEFRKIKLRLDEIQLERTIAQLHCSLPTDRAQEAEATLRRIYSRARRWDDLELATGTVAVSPALSPDATLQGGCHDDPDIRDQHAERDPAEKT